jgi:hypothetical protein
MDAKRAQRILGNCHPLWWGQFQEDDTQRRVWAKLRPEQIIDQLDNCAYTANFMAREVLGLMETRIWRLRATVHAGGTGDARGVDDSPHISLQVGTTSYHLRCKEMPSLHIIQITR